MDKLVCHVFGGSRLAERSLYEDKQLRKFAGTMTEYQFYKDGILDKKLYKEAKKKFGDSMRYHLPGIYFAPVLILEDTPIMYMASFEDRFIISDISTQNWPYDSGISIMYELSSIERNYKIKFTTVSHGRGDEISSEDFFKGFNEMVVLNDYLDINKDECYIVLDVYFPPDENVETLQDYIDQLTEKESDPKYRMYFIDGKKSDFVKDLIRNGYRVIFSKHLRPDDLQKIKEKH